MNSVDFVSLLFEKYPIYLVLLCIQLVFFTILVRKKKISIIDPFFFQIVGCAFANIIPFFLYLTGQCPQKHFIFFVISETAFWVVLLLFWKPTKFAGYKIINEHQYARLLFWMCLSVYMLSNILTYIYVGIALNMESRLELYTESSGLGILGRLSDFACLYIVYYSFDKILKCRRKKYAIVFLFVIVNSFLSGSRSSILILLVGYYIYAYFYVGKMPRVKKKYIALILLFPVLLISMSAVSDSGGFYDSLGEFSYRVLSYGDCYWSAYPDNMIDTVKFNSPFKTFFSGLLGPFRIIDVSKIDISIGTQLLWNANPLKEGIMGGPNSRPPIMGWCYFGWSGIFFTAFCGWLSSMLLFRLRKLFPNSFLGVFVYGYLYYLSTMILTDFSLFLGSLATMLINLILYGSLLLLLSDLKIKYVRLRNE